MGKRKEHPSDRLPTAKRPGQINSSTEANDAKMPRFKDSRPTIRIRERAKRSRPTSDILYNDAGDYFSSRERVLLDNEALPSPASTPRLYRRNYDNRPELHHLPLSEENLRKLERSRESNSPPSAYMRKRGSPTKKDKRKEKEDRNSHPLNLPPEDLRRLSAAIARAESARGAMDVDGSDQNGVTSPPAESPPVAPAKDTPGAFPETTNGTATDINGKEDKSPTPPPHRSPMKSAVDAEACKAAGNKFFKAKDYLRAVTEYTKGTTSHVTSKGHHSLIFLFQPLTQSRQIRHTCPTVLLRTWERISSNPPWPTQYVQTSLTLTTLKSSFDLHASTHPLADLRKPYPHTH
jgi:hypothetical protein